MRRKAERVIVTPDSSGLDHIGEAHREVDAEMDEKFVDRDQLREHVEAWWAANRDLHEALCDVSSSDEKAVDSIVQVMTWSATGPAAVERGGSLSISQAAHVADEAAEKYRLRRS